MANNEPNLKVKATMDNSDIKKRSQESKEALRDFQKTGTDAVNRLGEAFGLNTGKIDGMLSSLRGLGLRLQESGNAGSAAFGKMLQGVNGFSASLAGIGIAGILAGFKALNEEATAFKNTMAGASIDVQTTAYVDTYRQVLHDFNAETGKNVAEAQASWTKAWAEFTANLNYAIVNGSVGPFQSVLGGVASLFSGGDTAATDRANEAATEAERLAGRMFDLQRRISDQTVVWARMEREIAEQKRIAYDKTVDTATQQEALARSVELIRDRYKEEAILRGQLADLQEQYNSLAESSVADIDKANQLRMQEEATVARMNNALRELSERQATVTLNAQKEAQARAEALAAEQQLAQSRAELAAWGQMASSVGTIEMPQAEALSTSGIAVPVVPQLEENSVIDLTNELQSMVSSSFETIGVSIGNLVGDLATGGDAWGNFASTAVSAFGDMAIAVGKLAISTGTATLGIKAALESLNGYAAIAAGVALVALGSALKAGLSNIAGGNYNTSSSVASSTGSYGSSSVGTSFETREINIKVSGKLQANGNVLSAVIENEKKRKDHTT